MRSCVFRSPHSCRNASRSRSSSCGSLIAPRCAACRRKGRRERAADERVVIADPPGPPRQVDAELEGRLHRFAADPDRRSAAEGGRSRRPARAPRAWLHRSGDRGSRRRHRPDADSRAAVRPPRSSRPCRSRSSRTRAGRGAGDRPPLRSAAIARDQHFLRPAAGRDQSDASLDQPHVGLGRGHHAVAVQAHLAAAAEREAGRRDDDGHVRVLERHRGALERRGPSGRPRPSCLPAIRAAGASGWRRRRSSAPRCRRRAPGSAPPLRGRPLEHLDRVAADGVHLRVELDREHVVAEIDQAARGVAADDLAPRLRRAQDLDIRTTPGAPADGAACGAAAGRRLVPAPQRRAAAGQSRRSVDHAATPIASHVSNGPAPSRSPIASPDRHRRSNTRCAASLARRRGAAGPSVSRRNWPALSCARNRNADAVRRPFHVPRRIDRRQTRAAAAAGSPSPGGSRVRISSPRLLVEALTGLAADPVLARTSAETSGGTANSALAASSSSRSARLRITSREHVEPGDVHRPERRALRPADGRPGDRVDLFDREAA